MSKARELPKGWQMPGPRAAQNLQIKCLTSGTDKAGKCPAEAPGGGGGESWAQLELTNA